MSGRPTYGELEQRIKKLEHTEFLLKRSKVMAKENKTRYQQLFDEIKDGLAVYEAIDGGKDFIFRDINAAGERIRNVKKSEIIGKSLYEIRPNIDEFGLVDVLRRVWRTGKTEHHAERFYQDKNLKGWFDNYVYRLESGELVAIFADNTARKQTEEVLRKSEAELFAIYNNSPMIMLLVDEDRRVLKANRLALESTGRQHNEIEGLRGGEAIKCIHAFDDPEGCGFGVECKKCVVRNTVLDSIKTGTGYHNVEASVQLDLGSGVIELFFLVSTAPLYVAGNKTVLVCLEDITDRKQAEASLRESQETFLTVLDSIDATIYVADMETHEILFMNKYMKNSFGADFTGKICWEVFRHESGPCGHCSNDKLFDQEGNPSGVQVWTDQNPVTGRRYINYDRAVKWTDGHYVRLQVATDITELKKLESQLQQSQKMESIGTLAGGIAHDFNNILFPIVGHAEMLIADVPEDSSLRDGLDEIYTSALRAKDLVKQILTFSRQENGELKLMKMQPVIKEALKLIRSTIPATIDIKQDIETDCGIIKADPTQIHQIIMNLTTNAYHAMENTGGELRVGLKEIKLKEHDLITPDMSPGIYACLSIADTGVGIEKALIDKIFDPFFTTKEKGKGTGMGLSVVHGIIKSIGGSIQVYSEPGKGTEFKAYFPIKKSFFKKSIIQTEKPIQGGTEQVLLVDDEEAILKIEKQMLERLGYQITSRTSSIEALEAFSANPDKFNLVITDMAMPNMSGDKLAVELIKIRADIPILLCTGFSETMSEEEAAPLGIKGFLLKPIVMKDFDQKIRKVLDKS